MTWLGTGAGAGLKKVRAKAGLALALGLELGLELGLGLGLGLGFELGFGLRRGRTEAGQLGDVEAAKGLHRGRGVGRSHEAQADAPDVVRVGQVRVPLPLHVQRAAQPRPAAAEPGQVRVEVNYGSS